MIDAIAAAWIDHCAERKWQVYASDGIVVQRDVVEDRYVVAAYDGDDFVRAYIDASCPVFDFSEVSRVRVPK